MSKSAKLGAIAALPLVLGMLLPVSLIDDGHSLCVFRDVTGLPCPFCGATRAFIAFGHGRSDWMQFNGYWVLLSLAALAASVAIALAKWASKRPLAMPVASSSTALIVLVLAPGWIWALINHSRIV